jgi:FkbM family methyltransferase
MSRIPPEAFPATQQDEAVGGHRLFRLANRLYRRWPSLYLPLYTLYKRVSDRSEFRAMRAAIRPGMRCVDVGANVGVVTRHLARLVGPSGSVLAFEPSPENFAVLSRRRWGPNVRLVQAAVGATSGQTTLFVSDDLNVDHRTYATERARRRVPVPQVRLDDAVGEAAVDFVKMDIQGYEVEALRGMSGLLRRSGRLAMIVEFWPWGLRQAGATPDELLALLGDAGFELKLLSGEPVRPWSESPTWYRNLLASRP